MIYGKRVYLRLMEEKDIELKVKWVNDPEIRETLISEYISIASTKQWFNQSIADSKRKDFIICLKDNNQAIGFTSLKSIDYINSKAEMTMCLGEKKYWGKGLAKEAKFLVLDYAFLELGINKVYVYNWIKNKNIIAFNKKIGFKIEGELRNDVFFKGEYRNMIIMGILKDEWMENRLSSSNV